MQKATYRMIPFIGNVQERQMYREKKQTVVAQCLGWEKGLSKIQHEETCGADGNVLKPQFGNGYELHKFTKKNHLSVRLQWVNYGNYISMKLFCF